MPELPEVETIVRGLASRITGDEIESVWLGQKKEPLKSPAQEIAVTLEHSRIAAVRRMGKHIVFDLERNSVERRGLSARGRIGQTAVRKKPEAIPQAWAGKSAPRSANSANAQWIVHLGMTGRLQICPPEAEIEKHTHAVLKLASGRELRFVDPRRFGRLSVSAAFDAGGIEPLEVDPHRFMELFRARKTPIKSALLNQELLRGVGNIYADESLFRAGIRPRRRAATITREQFAKLHSSIKDVLQEAIALGGSSISNYVDADGEEGFFHGPRSREWGCAPPG